MRAFKACLFLFLSISPILAQTSDTATILGQVSDPSHALVPGAQIALTNALTGLKRTTITDSAGKFSLAGLPVAGSYRLTASKAGFADAHVDDLTLVAGRTANVSLQLNIAGGATAVEVTGVAGGVLTDEPQLEERISSLQAQETPLLNRRISYLPLLNS
ncbi:MAG TPA: carboxypeptidase-like regulatory domain-containing protein, partial [Terriglobales bacterium]|nr:carboxypeptidase-like regulatory domain-containing protein [Terriglobales bacterium]